MKILCFLAAISLLVLFSAVNLFLPYAILVFAAFVALGFGCGVISKARNRECKIGFC